MCSYRRADRQTPALFRMYCAALKLERGRESGECGSSCSVLTPSPKKNIDSFRNGMGETNEALADDDDGGGERRRSERGVREEGRGFLDDGAGLGRG